MIVQIRRGRTNGTIIAPASKSHTIRALLIAALAEGESIIENYLDSNDTHACMNALYQFGAKIEGLEVDDSSSALPSLRVLGIGSGTSADNIIEVANSGTTLFLSAGLAALAPDWTFFTGDEQIRNRSAEHLLKALKGLGAEAFSARGNGRAPFAIRGPMTGGQIELECPVSQYLSSLMLACPLIDSSACTEIYVTLLNERPYAEMTEYWLKDQGIDFENQDWKRIRIPGGQKYRPFRRQIPGDFSTATFFACAAAISGGSLLFKGLDMSDSQGDRAVFSVLENMGCRVELRDDGLCIMAENGLQGGDFDLNDMPDALPALAITAACARGETRLMNVPQARLKETDRISCMSEELNKLGIQNQELPDGLIIHGSDTVLEGDVTLNGHGDHRIVMACSLAGLVTKLPVQVSGAEAVSVTSPRFFSLLSHCTESEDGRPILQQMY